MGPVYLSQPGISMTFKPFQHRLEYICYRCAVFLVGIIPESLIPRLGNGLGNLLFFLGIRRSVVETNLNIAFGDELTKEKRKELCKKTYQHTMCSILEFLLMNFITPERLPNYIEIEGLNILQKAVNEGNGVFIAGSHFGNWELFSAGICVMGTPIHVYSGMQKNQLMDQAINNVRRRFGQITFPKSKKAALEMMRVLKNKGVLAVLGDLNVPHNRLFVDFFGKKAAVGQGLATITIKKDAALLFLWSVRTGPLKHHGYIIRLAYSPTGNKEIDTETIAQRVASELEQRIRQNPDHYFWFNRRWKTRPSEDRDAKIY